MKKILVMITTAALAMVQPTHALTMCAANWLTGFTPTEGASNAGRGGTWAVAGNTTSAGRQTVSGISICSISGAGLSGSGICNDINRAGVAAATGRCSNRTTSPAVGDGGWCWCRMTSPTLGAVWFFNDFIYEASSSACAYSCATSCAQRILGTAGVRAAVLAVP